jgi:dipeptidyl aminopeptidase/acylaminoacyl peptidase
VLWIDLASGKTDTIFKKFNDAKNYVLNEEGDQLAFVAERDSAAKALTKFYKLYYYKPGNDSAAIIAEKNTVGMKLGNTINANLVFSKDGKKLFFGTAPIKAPKDTTLVDFELSRLDVWHYNDDYLQPQQLRQLDGEIKRSYTAVIKPGDNKVVQLGAEDAERITLVNEGNADWVLAESNKGNRKQMQWEGRTKITAYVISTDDGAKKLVLANSLSNFNVSPAGKYVYWYDDVKRNYFTYDVATGLTKNVTAKIKVPLYDEDNDVPDHPDAYGVMGWSKNDEALFVYDRYEAWEINFSTGKYATIIDNVASNPRKNKKTYRYISTDREQRFIQYGEPLLMRVFDNSTKQSDLCIAVLGSPNLLLNESLSKNSYGLPLKAKNADTYIYTKENYTTSPNLFFDEKLNNAIQLSDINPQQKDFNWGTAELFKWKAYNGKESEGIIYKPENFDPKKKYPMISYFYEKLSDGLYGYIPPSPTPSRLNISFFVSRGYVVFAPDISYTTGHPGNDAYNYIVSGARAVVKLGYVDSTKLGLQGQSWGGYQIAILITKTKSFAAAWAGAPVANMTSAYGGIRWGTGLNRQFQYEKTQSRIGATLWEKQNLYIENSPLFHLPKVTTPLVIMHNDADDAVPWYQGIEMFTAMRRLNKPVWLLVYNNEAHNLIERKNRKDIQVREQQFFDWKLKGEKPAKWLTDGVPATQKGIDWGLKVE